MALHPETSVYIGGFDMTSTVRCCEETYLHRAGYVGGYPERSFFYEQRYAPPESERRNFPMSLSAVEESGHCSCAIAEL